MKTKYVIGVDLGGTNIKCGIVTEDGEIVKKVSVKTLAKKGPETVIEQMKKGIKHLLENETKKIKGIGVGAPGIVKPKKGSVENPPNLPGWGKVHLGNILEQEFNYPVFLENDDNAAAIGEMIFGAGKEIRSFIFVTLGTGVGGGIIHRKKLIRGDSGAAGEIGHVSIDYKGRKCNCGSRGCIEAYIGNAHLVDRAKRSLRYHPESKLHRIIAENNGYLSPRLINEAAKQKDGFALNFIRESGKLLGYALASTINVLDIPTIIIGGGTAGFGKPLFESVKEGAVDRVLKSLKPKVNILPAQLKNDAGIKGASALVFYNLKKKSK